MDRTVSKAGLQGGAEVSPEQEAVLGPAEPSGCRRREPRDARRLVYHSIAVRI